MVECSELGGSGEALQLREVTLNILTLTGVSKHYPAHHAVTGVSLEVEKGEFFSLLGPSGCGKTTTLRLIAGFEDPTRGEISINGQSVQHLRPYQRNVSTVFQNYALFPHLTVQDNVEFGLRRRGENNIAARVREALEMVQLGGKESRKPAELSGGERQRAALARSLVLAPDVLLLDEPLSALDPALRKQVRAELKSLQRRVGITFLFVTHDQEEALSMSDRIGVMNQGRLEQVGTPQDIYLRPRTRFVASFLGAINWINGIGVRPEATRIARTGVTDGARPAVVLHSTFLGNIVQVHARLGDGAPVMAEVSRLHEPFAPGDTVHVWWNPGDELTFE
ncbi:MAG: ABC transporter ATP-binding protein [Bryobacteraceae bacterium]